MKVNHDCRLQGHVTHKTSPFFNERPDPDDVSLLIIHAISLPPEQFGSGDVDALFMGTIDRNKDPYFKQIEQIEVSAHIFIDREGHITQYVPFDKRAWHAGSSCFQSRQNCNDFAIGIELEGSDSKPFELAQYDALVEASAAIMQRYPKITAHQIVGHSDVAPGRKTDPGPFFDWQHYKKMLEFGLYETE